MTAFLVNKEEKDKDEDENENENRGDDNFTKKDDNGDITHKRTIKVDATVTDADINIQPILIC